jgi:predicted transcriptional regulator
MALSLFALNSLKVWRELREKFAERVITLKGQEVKATEKIPIEDLLTILSYLTQRHKIFMLHTKSERACYLGRIYTLDSKNLTIDSLSTRGTWDGQMTFKIADIKTIEFDTDYINSLKLIQAGKTKA